MNIFKSNKGKWLVLTATGTVVIVVVLAIILTGLRGGEASDKLAKEQAQGEALAAAKKILSEADNISEMPEYDGSDGYGFAVNDRGGNMIAGIVADKITGEIDFLVDLRAESYSNISGEVNIGIDEATKIAEEFLSSQGVDISEYGLEHDPLHTIAWNDSDMANPIPIYQYDFYYRIWKDGIFVDDFSNGGGYCSISISPEDGKILSFFLPRNSLSVKDKSKANINIEKEKAIDLAVKKVPTEEGREQVPVLSDNKVELRYWLDGSTLVPYWTIGIDLYEGGFSVSGVDISISAVDGSVIAEGYR